MLAIGLDPREADAIHGEMRLIDDLAAGHVLYPRPIPTVPDVMVLDIPARYASPSLPLGRFYPIILETDAERAELMAYLRDDRPAMIAPNLLDHRPSALITTDILFCRYEPPMPGWPWLLLCQWPARFTRMTTSAADDFARSAYTTELFRSPAALDDMQAKLLGRLGSDHALTVRHVASGPAGHA